MNDRLAADNRRSLLRLAGRAVCSTVDGSALPEPPATDGPLGEPRGVFVTLTRDGRLRGCLGRIDAPQPLALGVVATAAAAAREDPRFEAVRSTELAGLHIELSVLDVPQPADEAEIEPGRDGVILEVDDRRAVFLPEVAERHGWDRSRLLAELSRKAGLEAGAWRRGTLLRFGTERFGALLESVVGDDPR